MKKIVPEIIRFIKIKQDIILNQLGTMECGPYINLHAMEIIKMIANKQ